MSQPSMPAPDAAYAHLVQQVQASAFFHKLASVYNISPQNDAEARSLFELGGRLTVAEQHPAIAKQAAAASDRFSTAVGALDATMNHLGLAKAANSDQHASDMATAFMADAATYNAVLSVKCAQAVDAAIAVGLLDKDGNPVA